MAGPKTFHRDNPSDMAKWEEMPDDKDFYVVLPGHIMGVIAVTRPMKVFGFDGTGTTLGEPIHAGSIVPAKAFGPGAELQRHVNNGAIREATPWEVEALRSRFEADAGKTTPLEGKMTNAMVQGQATVDVNATPLALSQPPRGGGDAGKGGK